MITALLLLAAALAQAAPVAPAPVVPAPPDREVRELDIAERHIVQVEDYQAGRVVRLRSDDSGALLVDVGVALAARRIDVTLRNVQGHVRFHADLTALSQRLQILVTEVDGAPPSTTSR
jgi:hypothetical protein